MNIKLWAINNNCKLIGGYQRNLWSNQPDNKQVVYYVCERSVIKQTILVSQIKDLVLHISGNSLYHV